ncbi:hypothetical protein CN378_00125 [Bacillus sp. AFS015802]|nr:hypothetical protein CN378_00125 [Bacillus sp. AFS015802]
MNTYTQRAETHSLPFFIKQAERFSQEQKKEDKSFSKAFVFKGKKLEWVLHNKDLNRKESYPTFFFV